MKKFKIFINRGVGGVSFYTMTLKINSQLQSTSQAVCINLALDLRKFQWRRSIKDRRNPRRCIIDFKIFSITVILISASWTNAAGRYIAHASQNITSYTSCVYIATPWISCAIIGTTSIPPNAETLIAGTSNEN